MLLGLICMRYSRASLCPLILPCVLTATHSLGAATSPCSRTGCCAWRCTRARAASRRMVSRCSHVSGAGNSAQPSAARRPNPAL
eukprot:scaffold12986_cov79-Phaeocystis_antarctica.AAC.2